MKYVSVWCLLIGVLVSPLSIFANDPANYTQVEVDLTNADTKMGEAVENYDTIRSALVVLNDDWDSNQAKVALGVKVTVSVSGGAVISVAAAFISGGTLAPAAFAGYLAAEALKETIQTSWESKKYIDAIETT